ncbi:hypothetical protein [Streptomyces sp. NPDC088789]|uniref:hypothetical protein n=1 Tax=Streptomyces sp. NPDC088789 TaxID=3365899 RepID=UPI00381F48B4
MGRRGCELLLGDFIALADRDPAMLPRLLALVDGICRTLHTTTAATGATTPLSRCRPGLYADRIRRGGRLDTWYLRQDLPLSLPGTRARLTAGQLRHYTLTVNGRPLTVNLPALINDARRTLTPRSRWTTAITQGDPTEPNIADPLCWLDFEHAGRNTLPGESAALLWYLMAHGGWLVPRHQPGTHRRTLRLALAPHPAPLIEHLALDENERHITLRYTWNTGTGRHAALTRALLHLAPAPGFLDGTRAFLTLRILGVIPPTLLRTADLLLVHLDRGVPREPGEGKCRPACCWGHGAGPPIRSGSCACEPLCWPPPWPQPPPPWHPPPPPAPTTLTARAAP